MASILAKNFTLPTILLSGTCIQSLLTLILPFRYAFLPAFILLIGQVLNAILISQGVIKNPYMKNARLGKYTAQIPNADGTISPKASDKGVVVFLIGAVSHRYVQYTTVFTAYLLQYLSFLDVIKDGYTKQQSSPQGIFDPNFRKVADYFRNMFVGIEADAAKWGCEFILLPYLIPLLFVVVTLTQALLILDLGTGHRTVDLDDSNSLATLNVTYWQSIEQLHAYAQSPAHREGWAWWDEYRKQHNAVGIYHETYFAPAGQWETIYENCMPTGLGKSWSSFLLLRNSLGF